MRAKAAIPLRNGKRVTLRVSERDYALWRAASNGNVSAFLRSAAAKALKATK